MELFWIFTSLCEHERRRVILTEGGHSYLSVAGTNGVGVGIIHPHDGMFSQLLLWRLCQKNIETVASAVVCRA